MVDIGVEISIRYFAGLREAVGREAETLGARDGTRVAAIRERIAARYPSAAALLARCAVAVNSAYAGPETPLHDGDVLAFLPPVGGG